jgi:Flp pilus assembly protein TadB
MAENLLTLMEVPRERKRVRGPTRGLMSQARRSAQLLIVPPFMAVVVVGWV